MVMDKEYVRENLEGELDPMNQQLGLKCF